MTVRGHPSLTDPEVAELLARARRLKPIPLLSSAAPNWTESREEWVDTAHADPWGAPPRGPQVLGKTWTGGNCLRACVGSLLGAAIEKVPDPRTFGWAAGWVDQYSKQLAKQTGYRLEELPASLCPPRNPNRLWIATISEPGDADHCVICRGYFVVHDQSAAADQHGGYHGPVPMDRLVDGLLVVPARRVVPVFSPLGNGYAIVPA